MACPHCDDTGWKRIVVDGVRRVARCDCWRAGLVEKLLQAARIPPRYRRCDLDNFRTDTRSLVEALRTARAFVEAYPVVDKGLLLLGKPGVGKTHLATACLKEVIRRTGARGLFYDTRELLRLIRDTYNPEVRTTEWDVIRPVVEADLLVLDDLGAEKPSEWVAETLNLIVNTRYNQKLPTLITSNYPDAPPSDRAPGETLSERVGVRMYSRLHEMCHFLVLESPDFRELGADPSAEALASFQRRGGRAAGDLPARAKSPAKAQLRDERDRTAELKWPGGRAGTP
jgi:DNA replication protein DnaC